MFFSRQKRQRQIKFGYRNVFILIMKKRIHNQTSLFGPDYAYLVVLSPPDDIKADIALIKKELNAIADITEKNVHSIAHITLTDRRTDDEALPEIIKELTSGSKPSR